MNKLATGLGTVVGAMWTASMTADIFIKTYDPPAMIHTAMMLVLGGIFGKGVLNKGND